MGLLACDRRYATGQPALPQPELLEVPRGLSSKQQSIAEGRIWLLKARRCSPRLAVLKKRMKVLDLNSQQADAILEEWRAGEGASSANGSGRCESVTLLYASRPVLSVSGHSGAFFAGPVVYPGGELRPDGFSIFEYPAAQDDEQEAWEFLVVVQPPYLGELETLVSSHVNGEVDDLNIVPATRSCSWAPLLAMEGGWAIGGIAAVREIHRLRNRWSAASGG